MSTKAVITRRGASGTRAESAEGVDAARLGFKVEAQLPQGTLISDTGSAGRAVRDAGPTYAELEEQGFRVKVLPDTNILEVGTFRIDTEATPPMAPRASEERGLTDDETWTHHLVQLIAPPNEEWIRTIEAQGVDVVEPISRYGLFVIGSPDTVRNLESLPFVAWTGPFKPEYRIAGNLKELQGRIQYVNVGVYPESAVPEVRRGIEAAGGTIVDEWGQEGSYRPGYRCLIVEVDAQDLLAIASLPSVRWLEYQSPILTADDERSAQIVAENLDGVAPPNTGPVVGYQAALTGLGLSGAGVVVGICDSGVDSHNNATMHPDLAGRMSFFVDTTGGITPTDTDGHGTHVAGIAVGNAATGETDPEGFLLGQGIAPGAMFGSVNPVDTPGGPGTGPVATFTQTMVNNGAHVMSNSWRQLGGGGYTANAALVDELVRDPNNATADLDYLVIVFSSGNSGPGAGTITAPKEAKNPIVVGNAMNFRPGEALALSSTSDDIRGINRSSSRGPADDGRILPTIVAPGTDIISTRSTVDANTGVPGVQRPRTAYTDTDADVHQDYTPMTGTSMAAPHVSGLCALLIEWWHNRTGGKNPSPALLKALLINGAEDLAGGPDGDSGAILTNIPNNVQGWGRVSLENMVLQAPASDRGPKIFSDQKHAFTADGQELMIRVAPVDTGRPLRVTLVWTDAPGAANASPALVNDLDLEVTEVDTANVFKGNVFTNGFSTTGGVFDTLNNIECVYVQNPDGTYEVRVIAANIAASARPDVATPWQDFALVIDNAEVPAAAPVSVVPVIDRSGSMVAYGYEAITRISSKQFVDLMGVDDSLGVVSFGDAGAVEFPAMAPLDLQTITGQPVRDAAKAEIDGIAFGGCTFMGDGIVRARDLLNPAAGSRAMVLLSDGYDNKGCQPANPARPSALEAVATLPANLAVYTCAMGPSSDQVLLEQIADVTDGRYYFMPSIDDLFEIYNYIRGQVTGDSIVVNESAMASSSRVAAFVDALASQATFSVAWADPRLRFVPGEPRKENEVCVRLRDPRGRLLHPHSSHVRRIIGAGYVIFKLQEPLAGQWFVEVSTAGDTHVRYTVGGFVRSRLRLVVSRLPKVIVPGLPLTVAAQVFDGKQPIQGFRATSRVVAPALSLRGMLDKFRDQLTRIRPSSAAAGDGLPSDIGKLLALRNKLVKERQPDIFAPATSSLTFQSVTLGNLRNQGLGHLLPSDVVPAGLGGANANSPTALSGVLRGLFRNTRQQGSYNVEVTASGTSPVSDTRFIRKEMVSVLVK